MNVPEQLRLSEAKSLEIWKSNHCFACGISSWRLVNLIRRHFRGSQEILQGIHYQVKWECEWEKKFYIAGFCGYSRKRKKCFYVNFKNWDLKQMDDVTAGKSALCLFDNFFSSSSRKVWEHMKEVHNFTLEAAGIDPNDDHKRIRLINYLRDVRINGGNPLEALKSLKADSPVWSDDSFLTLRIANDMLLWDFTNSEEEDQEVDDEGDDLSTNNTSCYSENRSLSDIDPPFQRNDNFYHHQYTGRQDQMQYLPGHQNQMQNFFKPQDIPSHQDVPRHPQVQRRYHDRSRKENHYQQKQHERPMSPDYPKQRQDQNSRRDFNQRGPNKYHRKQRKHQEIQSLYFETYDSPEIHRSMISDLQRTNAYRDFILQNSHLFKDKVVLDVGCGTGILSFFAVQAGAKFVVGVDAAHSTAQMAEMLAKDNGIPLSKFNVVAGVLEQMTITTFQQEDGTMMTKAIPNDLRIEPEWKLLQVDIIISEWMGYAMMFESMLKSVIHARGKYLKAGGLVIPNKMSLHLAVCDMSEHLHSVMSQWDSNQTKERLGVDLARIRPLESTVLLNADVLVVPPCVLRSAPTKIGELDLMEVTEEDCRCMYFNFEVKTCKDFENRVRTTLGNTCCAKCALKFVLKQNSQRDEVPQSIFDCSPNEWFQKSPFGIYDVENQRSLFTSFVMHFDAHFVPPSGTGGKEILLSTSPLQPPTHWGQTIMHLRSKSTSRIEVPCQDDNGNDVLIRGNLSLNRHSDNFRHLKIHIELTEDLIARNGTLHSESRYLGKPVQSSSTEIVIEANSHFVFEIR